MVKFWTFHLKRDTLVSRGLPGSKSNSQCISMLSLSMPSIKTVKVHMMKYIPWYKTILVHWILSNVDALMC